MASKDLMHALNRRLDPVRDEFKLQLYEWSLGVLELQVSDRNSLFWRVPSRVIKNLQLLQSEVEDPLRFFLIRHARRHQWALSRRGEPFLPEDEASVVLERCINPQGPDVTQKGLLPLWTPVPRLNRRKLGAATRENLSFLFEDKTDPSDHGEWTFESRVGPWQFVVQLSADASQFQLDLEFDVLLGMGDLSLARQLSLHRLFGIGPSAWDLIEPGGEQKAADLVREYSQFMLNSMAPLLSDLDPQISKEEVGQAEREWKEWLAGVRSARKPR